MRINREGSASKEHSIATVSSGWVFCWCFDLTQSLGKDKRCYSLIKILASLFFYSSPVSVFFFLFRGVMDLKPVSETLDVMWEYTMDGIPFHAFTHIHTFIRI